MAQVESPTNKLYAAAAIALKGDSHDSWTHIALDEADMSAFTEATNALGTESSKSGLARAAATVSNQTTSVADDTVRATKTFTAGETATIYGFAVFTAAAAGNIHLWCAFAAALALENTDQLVCTGNNQFKKD